MTTVITVISPPTPPIAMVTPMACGPCSASTYDPNAMEAFCPTSPDMAVIGPTAPDTLVTVSGRNFTDTCQVHLDGLPQATTFINSSALQFTVKPSTVTAPGTSIITVIETAP